MAELRMYDIIDKKKNGEALTREEIAFVVQGYTAGDIPDYQVSSLLMAICLRGMTDAETFYLTDEMVKSGSIMDLSAIEGKKVDKHSTGGVGDKTSLVLGPMLAACGAKVAKASGRGLGHTGGTLDKLESIPGFRVTLSHDEFVKQVSEIGVAIVGQSEDIAPADKKLYALRDVTATVDSIPLIASSIMCKKIADGSDIQLLDVKFGNGAFMKTIEDARKLAKTMIAIGKRAGRVTCAEISSMEQPLGMQIGNSLEVIESIETLRGNGPKDLVELCCHSGATLLVLAGLAPNEEVAVHRLQESITSGRAFDIFCRMVEMQGGDVAYVRNPEMFPKAKYTAEVKSLADGYVTAIDTYDLGIQAMTIGAGRRSKSDPIDFAAGITLKKKIGDRVSRDEVIAVLHSERPKLEDAVRSVLADFEIRDGERPEPPVLIRETIYDAD